MYRQLPESSLIEDISKFFFFVMVMSLPDRLFTQSSDFSHALKHTITGPAQWLDRDQKRR